MREQIRTRQELLLLLSLLLVILMYPMLEDLRLGRLMLGLLIFIPLILVSTKMSQKPGWIWPLSLLTSIVVICRGVEVFSPSKVAMVLEWSALTAFFGLTSLGLFSYIKSARVITGEHLYTAASIYLLLGMQWFALYSVIETVYPGSFQHGLVAATDRQSDLLYFSLVTLATVGYGDILPLHREVRMLAALEGVTGVLYIAITVALLVSAYRQHDSPS